MKTEALKVTVEELTIAGFKLLSYMLSDGSYRFSLSELVKVAGVETKDAARELAGSNVPQNLAIETVKARQRKGSNVPVFRGNLKVYLCTPEQAAQAWFWLAMQGNKPAAAISQALMAETLQRRLDFAFGVEKTEDTYEEQTKEFFRELARKSFHPQLTSAMNGSFANNRWGAEVNKFKSAAGLPLVCVDDYGKQELELWTDAMSRYNCLTNMGKSHKQALQEITRQRIDREVSK